jgi:ATP-dependent DNA ligase
MITKKLSIVRVQPYFIEPNYAFDVLIHRGRDVLRLPLETRRELLADALVKVEYPVLRSSRDAFQFAWN